MTASEREPQFSQWYPWNLEERLESYTKPGVYALARFESVPLGGADPLCRETIYIGETCGQTLGKRLYQFDCSAFRQKNGHSGGWTYAGKFSDGSKLLHFAVCPIS